MIGIHVAQISILIIGFEMEKFFPLVKHILVGFMKL